MGQLPFDWSHDAEFVRAAGTLADLVGVVLLNALRVALDQVAFALLVVRIQ